CSSRRRHTRFKCDWSSDVCSSDLFSSADGILGTIDLSQNNFLGRGWLATIKIRAGANIQQGQLSFTEPWLFDRPLAAGFDLFSRSEERRVGQGGGWWWGWWA